MKEGRGVFKNLKNTAKEVAFAFTEASTNTKLLKILLPLFDWAFLIYKNLLRSHFQGLKCKHVHMADVAQARELKEQC